MIVRIYSVRDRAIGTFMQSFPAYTDQFAKRMFADQVNAGDDKSNLCRHPEDFELYFLAEFDDQEGTFASSKPQMIAVGHNLVRSSAG